MERLGKMIGGVRFFFSLISSFVLIILPIIGMLNDPTDAKFVKNGILAGVSFIIMIITLVSRRLDKKRAKEGRKIAGKVRSFGKLIANIAMLVVLIMTWNTSPDISLLLPMIITSITVSISLIMTIFLLFIEVGIRRVKTRVQSSFENFKNRRK